MPSRPIPNPNPDELDVDELGDPIERALAMSHEPPTPARELPARPDVALSALADARAALLAAGGAGSGQGRRGRHPRHEPEELTS